ncbi:transglycosylase domain-containing protein [Cryptosporangium arvum]|uniref:transglycosylase domain-containing protein n=1 Tax=Cryptosporangium arvum TaxID=80871 RepID=UPI0006869B46|nr:transglycosylase domain-containing protein [Cryptosporangium arvum]
MIRWVVRVGAGVLIGVLALVVAGFHAVDLPPFPDQPQTSTAVSADGRHPLALFATENRQRVPLGRVPRHVQDAVVTAEDAGFWDDSDGVSLSGIGRAVLGLVRRNAGSGGGSTITQQYVRNALDLTRERSYSRKAKELVLAGKLARTASKEEILEGYLNTIYFGRGAFGIQAAAQAYFGRDVDELTAAQGAVLAAVIKDPTNFDPRIRPGSARGRWQYLIDRMVASGYLSPGSRSFPGTVARRASASAREALRSGWRGVLGGRIERELDGVLTEQQLYTGGYTITTTLDWADQQRAARAVATHLRGQDPRLTAAVVAIEPSTGRVTAYYGGEAGYGYLDQADTARLAAETYWPYVLAARLGGSPVPDTDLPTVSPFDQASGYATFADDGLAREPYFVQRVTAPDGTVVRERRPSPGYRVLPSEATGVLAAHAAARPGTSDGNTNAWMCGFTADRAVAVWVGSSGDDFPMRDARSGERVRGEGIPAGIWSDYLAEAG